MKQSDRSFGRVLRFVIPTLAAAFLAPAEDASAQEASGRVFEALANVDETAGNTGSVGCGGSSGINLSTALNTALDETGPNDEDRPIAQRRGLFRFCDVQTPNGANGWTFNDSLSSEKVSAQATAFSPEELFSSMDSANSAYALQTANVARRIGLLRLAGRGRAEPGTVAFARRDPPRSGGASLSGVGIAPFEASARDAVHALSLAVEDGIQSGDVEDGELGFFLNGRVIAIDGKQNAKERGSASVGGGFTLGLDRRVGESGYLGVAGGYTRVDTRYDHSGSQGNLDAATLSLYGALYPTERLYVAGTVAGTFLHYDSENEMIIYDAGPPVARLEGDTNGGSIGADASVGYDLPIESLTFSPYLRVSVLHTILDDFSQRGGDGSLDLKIDEQKTTSLTTDLGFRLGYTLSTKVAVLTPYVRAGYVHEFLDENDDIDGAFDALPGTGFRLQATSTDSDYANFGGGLAATFGQGFSQFVDYDVIALHRNVTIHQVTMGIRLEF